MAASVTLPICSHTCLYLTCTQHSNIPGRVVCAGVFTITVVIAKPSEIKPLGHVPVPQRVSSCPKMHLLLSVLDLLPVRTVCSTKPRRAHWASVLRLPPPSREQQQSVNLPFHHNPLRQSLEEDYCGALTASRCRKYTCHGLTRYGTSNSSSYSCQVL